MKKLMLLFALAGIGSGLFAQTTPTPAAKSNAPQETKMNEKSSSKTQAPKSAVAPAPVTPTAKATQPKKAKKPAEHKEVKAEKKAPEVK